MKYTLLVFVLIGADCLKMDMQMSSQKGAIIAYEEAARPPMRTESRQGQNTGELCDPQYMCMPISSCPLLDDLLDKSCLASDKLTALTCGWRGGEAYVCCPPGGSGPEGRPPGVMGDDMAGETGAQGPNPPGTDTCGKPMVQARSYTGVGSHPWLARIGFKNVMTGQMRFPCTGSIISKKVVLTAAHCALAKTEEYKISSVTLGEFNTQTDPDCGDMFCANPVQVLPISHIVVHPGYDRKIYRHDVALIVLKREMKYTVASLPICLAGQLIPATPAIRAVVAGWGRMGGQSISPAERQAVTVPLVPLAECAKLYASAAPLSSAQLCAGGEADMDVCAGFGGAPLVVVVDGRYTQIGIVSFGSEKCGSAGVPSVYTNVFSYANWIRENSPT